MTSFTSKDVARIAGVSQSTVSYVMTGKRSISEKTRQKVLAAMEQLTYQPHAGARALAGRRTQVIGLVVPFDTDGKAAALLPFIETIAHCARERDHEVLLVTADQGSAGLRRLAGRALCDAIVLMDILEHDERVPVAAELGVPVVLVGVPDDPAGLHCVDLDFEEAARLAVDELAATGHDEIVLVGWGAAVTSRRTNYAVRFLRSAQRQAGLHGIPLTVLEPVERGREAARQAADRILTHDFTSRPGHPIAPPALPEGGGRLAPLGEQPVPAHAALGEQSGRASGRGTGGRIGVVVAQGTVVAPLIHALRLRGVVPGRDLSLIGVSPDQEAEGSFTNVSEEPRDVSRRAMDTLFQLLDPAPGPAIRAIQLVAPRLTRRNTVMP
ncbi:LacI family DNA-binding transcriptional regulator [Actinoplanes sp. NPDC026619]|uniref:LacI family DNA-binding transcriptional regulator n=1 Tax=Actinoplanes sp. NPDC026619 TaxID=3155798 RepID=UPI0033C6B258